MYVYVQYNVDNSAHRPESRVNKFLVCIFTAVTGGPARAHILLSFTLLPFPANPRSLCHSLTFLMHNLQTFSLTASSEREAPNTAQARAAHPSPTPLIKTFQKRLLSPFSTPLCLFSRKSQILLLLSCLFFTVNSTWVRRAHTGVRSVEHP